MRKLGTILFAALAVSASARQITPDEAANVASEFFTTSSRSAVNVTRAQSRSRTLASDAAEPYYVFNADGDRGFVIISGDDRARKILGYADKGCFDFSNLPPQLLAMLDWYAGQIASLAATSPDPSWSTRSRTVAEGEGTLLETANWGQGYPYNTQCPVIDGEHTQTGCVATAMAIVMKYHNWPETGRGERHYSFGSDLLSANFGETAYSYNLMPLNTLDYSDSSNESAAGVLMYHAGISVNMIYGKDGSSAFMNDVPHALKEYFRYSTDCQILSKTNFSDEQWQSIIRNQIDNKRPVIYSGKPDDPFLGHAWVVDGYDKAGFFHCNFGWDGAANGYYSILDLYDPAYGIEFNHEQTMIINITPDYDDSCYSRYSKAWVEHPIHRIYGSENFTSSGLSISVQDIKQGEPFDANINVLVLPGGFCWKYGIALTDCQETIKEIIWETEVNAIYMTDNSFNQVDIPNVSVMSPIDETDKICVVTKVTDEDSWKLVPGTLEAPSCIPVFGNETNLCDVHFNIDNSLKLYLNKSWAAITENDLWNPENDFKVLNGSLLHFKIVRLYPSADKIITFDVDGFFNGEHINKVRTQEFDKDIVEGVFNCDKLEINITATYEESIDLKIEMTQAGELHSLLKEGMARRVRNLELSGPMNVYDMWYINDNCQALTELDMSNVRFEETKVADQFVYNSIINEIQNADEIPDISLCDLKRLKKIILPTDIKSIGMSFLDFCRLKEIELPQKVEIIYSGFMHACMSLKRIKILNPVPPIFGSEIGNFWYDTYDNVALFVPDESIDAYRSAPVWSQFVTIKGLSSLGGIQDIKLNLEKAQIEEGKTLQLTATVTPEDAHDATVTWSSSDENVARVSADGNVTAVSIGEAVITATAADQSGVSVSCIVTVLPISVESLAVTPETWDGIEGMSFAITATVLPENATNKSLAWSSSDTEIATVDADGNVTVLKEGYCAIEVITLDGSELSATCVVTSRSGIAEIFADKEANVDVYLPNGVLFKHNCTIEDAKRLASGIYIIRCGKVAKTVYIRN